MLDKQDFQNVLLENIKLDTIILVKFILDNDNVKVKETLKRIKTTVNLWLK